VEPARPLLPVDWSRRLISSRSRAAPGGPAMLRLSGRIRVRTAAATRTA
jgi:hypothetical protein